MLLLVALVLVGQGSPNLSGPQIIKKMNAAVRAGSPVSGELTTSGPRGQETSYSFQIMYPGLFAGKMNLFGFHTEIHINKTGYYNYMPGSNQYAKTSAPPEQGMLNMGLYGMDSLFGQTNTFAVAKNVTHIKFRGKDAYAIPITQSPSINISVARGDTIFVDAKTFLPLGFDEDDPSAGGTDHSVYKKLTLHAKLTKKDFDWHPPKGAKLISGLPKGISLNSPPEGAFYANP
jgi:outer membrane lipoprotein-sorting protein